MQTNKHYWTVFFCQKMILWMVAFCGLFLPQKIGAQATGNFTAEKFTGNYDVEKVRGQVGAFSLYRLDSKAIKALASAENSCFLNLDLAGERFASITLEAHDLRSDDYRLMVSGPGGLVELPRPANISYRGMTSDGGRVVLTIDDFFISGIITFGGQRLYIEPASRFDAGIGKDTYIMYRAEDVVPKKDNGCLMVHVEKELERTAESVEEQSARTPPSGCVAVRLAIASDASMFLKYGSIPLVTAQTMAVIALVNTDYDSDFNREIIFNIVENIVSTSAAACPESAWSSSTDANAVLTSFRNWGNGSGCGQFGPAFDLAELWTNRDFDGATVGLAYYPGVCGSFKYHILQDYTADMAYLRCMTSHEIGHNFFADHDAAAGNIMYGFVSLSTTWSALSKTAVNGREASSGCIAGPNALVGSPIAKFKLPSQWCASSNIALIDQSGRMPTGWNWAMPGSSPTSATTQSATAFYTSPGVKTIGLTASNANCGGAGTTTARTVTIIPDIYPSGHCTTGATNFGNADPYGMGVLNVALAAMTNPTNETYLDGTAFIDSTCNRVATLGSNSNTITITLGTTNPQIIRAWIDYDNDGVFESPSERIAASPLSGTTGANAFTFTVPNLPPPNATVTNTLLKMRVMADFYGSTTPDPCLTPDYGQSENYGVIILPSAVLPIELANFDAERTENGAMLHWRTLSESNNAHFIIERSRDGVRFEQIGKLRGAGSSVQPLDYHHLDATPWPGANFYRLVPVDFDGRSTYSEIKEVVFGETAGNLQALIAPNPIRGGVVNFRLFSENETDFTAEVFDLTGRLILAKSFETGEGWADFQLFTDGLPTGQFLLVLKNATAARVVKFRSAN